MSDDWMLLIVRASVLLLVSGCGVLLLMRWRPLLNPRWHRLAWGVVLIQGVMLFPCSWNVKLPTWLSAPLVSQSLSETPAWRFAPTEVPVLPRDIPPAVTVPVSADATQFTTPLIPDAGARPADAGVRPADAEVTAGAAPVSSPMRGSPSAVVDEFAEEAVAVAAVGSGSDTRRESTSGSASFGSDPAVAVGWLFRELTLVPWYVFLMVVWACGLLVMIGALMRDYILLNRALSRCRAARGSLAGELQDLCLELGLSHPVRLELHPQLGPFLCWTPRGHRVVVPHRLWNRLSAGERTAVLHHELCHLRRGDLWKSLLARLVVALHWFNPFAWISAARFDESAEWSCDTWMADEAPGRVTQLANALLAAAQAGEKSPMLALSATGGPLFRRVRRLVALKSEGDPLMQKCVWAGLLVMFAVVGGVRIQFTPTVEQSAGALVAAENAAPPEGAAETHATPAEPPTSPLAEIASRIVVGDNENLQKFVALIQSPMGEIVMADRAAVQAQNAESIIDPASLWEQFLERYFDCSGKSWTVRPEKGAAITEYLSAVKTGVEDEKATGAVFREVAEAIDEKPEAERSEVALLLRRFLQHEAAAAVVCQDELRARLHPGINELAELFEEYLVRTRQGGYLIRPARRLLVERRLAFASQISSVLQRFEKELAAWADDLVKDDDVHRQFAGILARPEFARYVVFSHISEESQLDDEALESLFAQLEEATSDTAAGLRLNLESEDFKALQEIVQRFVSVWENRQSLAEPLHRLADGIEESDELHGRLKAFLKTDVALMLVAHEMDYRPVPADTAAREWLTAIVTLDPAGRYEIASESTQDVKNLAEEYFRQFRDLRRRGRLIDEAAVRPADSNLRAAMQSLVGKLLLAELVEQSAERPEVDGLQLWFAEHFEETSDGLVLRDWAGDVVVEVIAQAAEVEKEFSKSDF